MEIINELLDDAQLHLSPNLELTNVVLVLQRSILVRVFRCYQNGSRLILFNDFFEHVVDCIENLAMLRCLFEPIRGVFLVISRQFCLL